MFETPFSVEVATPTEAHARLVMDWRNDPQTRASFIHREPKVWESFWPEFTCDYFKEPALPAVFALRGEERVAFLRFQTVPHPLSSPRRCCDISINVNPVLRAQGVGPRALELAAVFLRERGVVDAILAEIRVENASSVKAFEKAGYTRLDQIEKFIPDTGERCALYRYLFEVNPK